MTPEQRAWVRSPRGQMSLLGAVFVGSVLFSIACVLARGAFFETYVYEKHAPVGAHLATLTPEQLAVLPEADRKALYGQRIDTGAGVEPSVLAPPDVLHGWLRGTIVTGNPEQRREATALLPTVAGRGIDADVAETARYAHERAERLGDAEWAARARAVLDGL
ncbi:MAG: hypothetical protein R3F61_15375 [Myxococcota bacterium]